MSILELDLARFAKVRALRDGAKSAGERAAACNRLEAMASAAGMTVKQAIAMIERQKSQQSRAEREARVLDDLNSLFGDL